MSDGYSDTSMIHCSKCGTVLPDSVFNTASPVPCEGCGAELQVTVFPAAANGPGPVDFGEAIQTDDEASCFYHPEKRAVVACESCGRFVCSLCEISMAGRKLCPNCLDLGLNHGRIEQLVTHRTLHDQIALSLALYPIIMVFFTIITAPMAIYFSIRHWKSPTSILPRWSKTRFVFAIIIALLELGGWAAAFSHEFLGLARRL